jgi:hypothetical protein
MVRASRQQQAIKEKDMTEHAPGVIDPLPSFDPRKTNNTAACNEICHQETTGGMIPAVVGIVLLVLLGLSVSGDWSTAPNPTMTTGIERPTMPTEPTTTPTGATITPKTTPTHRN